MQMNNENRRKINLNLKNKAAIKELQRERKHLLSLLRIRSSQTRLSNANTIL